jgi:aryl-alcohol dehydrogenase-like predicted oxidoreductase
LLGVKGDFDQFISPICIFGRLISHNLQALKGVPRQAYYIGTKVGRFTQDVASGFDFSYARTIKSVDESLALLGLDYVDIIQVRKIPNFPKEI